MVVRAKLKVVDNSGPAMCQKPKHDGLFLIRCLTLMLMVVAASPLSAQDARVVPVNIFGDGNPLNGIEDNRRPVIPAQGNGSAGQQMYAGTITCDGKFRGTAMVIDTREFAPGLEGVVLATAAHVLYNLDKNRLFKRCKFHFMGWSEDSGYRSKINLRKVRIGDFNPRQSTGAREFGKGDWAFLYLRKPWKKFDPDQTIRPREFAFSQSVSYRQSGGEFRLLAFDSTVGFISESRDCTVVESKSDDLGGGVWKGQLLDDCDSADGASGGGIVAVIDQVHHLIGIRSGSHWNDHLFPPDQFPSGPPDGSTWNRQSNTNFGRAIDAYLMDEISQLIQLHGK